MRLTDETLQVLALKGFELVKTLATEVLESRAAEERWRSNSRETFDAMVAMRNDINEHIPLPSIDSDLARGPGNDVFCAEVAQGVVTALVAKDTEIERLIAFGDDAIASTERICLRCSAAEARVAELEALLDVDRLTEIITDSIDLDWTPRDAAKAIVRAMGGDGT